ncbi:cytochrome P450 [Rhodococcus maanshanensis]|uniref:Unspecific monooxygenase n=1 Tax=Rhodococcus maanshanensis TaxID=183556 RepID=A0A1H7RBE4_9NOCA|nr:cytochrome P450 [Rhodococcus maanshanensis]SEL57214.1 unspecific monooxygenase [Rhodococcus maanshanensis]
METRPIPHPPRRVPLLGDILGMDRSAPSQRTLWQHQRLGPIYQRVIVGTKLTFVTGSELVEEINDEKRFRKHVGRPLEKLRTIVADGLFTAFHHEPNWSKAHNILMPGFTREAMRGYHQTMLETTRELIVRWDEHATAEFVDVPAEMSKLTLEMIGRAGFGYSFDSFGRAHGGQEDPFVGAMLRALRHAEQTAIPIPFRGLFAGKAERQNDADIAYVAGVVDEVIAERRASPDETRRPDLLDLMLDSADPETGERLDEVNIRNQVLTFLVAGHETSANALAFALHFLAQNPEIAARARAEVESLWPGTDRPEVSFEQVAKLRYVRRVVDESMRLWPTAPGYFREAVADTTIGDGYGFAENDWAFVLVLGLHRDPVWGPDVETFDPDRFLPENVRARPGHVYKPFGTGLRACIGRQFALHEMVLALALLVHRYDLEPEPGYELRVKEQLTLKPEGLRLRVRRRVSP